MRTQILSVIPALCRYEFHLQNIPPEILIRAAQELDPQAFRVWTVVRAQRDDLNQWAHPQSELAAMLGQSITTVGRAFRDLKAAGLLRIVRETNRETVYEVRDPGDSSEPGAEPPEPPQPAQPLPETNRLAKAHAAATRIHDQKGERGHRTGNDGDIRDTVGTSDRIGYAKSGGSAILGKVREDRLCSLLTDHPNLPPQNRPGTGPSPAKSDGTPPLDRSNLADLADSSRARVDPKQKTKTNPPPPSDAGAREAAEQVGGERREEEKQEAARLLAGLRSAKLRRQLCETYPLEVIKTALSMAREARNVRDPAAVAASYLRDGGAAEEHARREAKKARAAAIVASRPAPAAEPAQPPQIDAATAQAIMDAATDEQIAAALESVEAQTSTRFMRTTAEWANRTQAGKTPPPHFQMARVQASHPAIRQLVVAAIRACADRPTP